MRDSHAAEGFLGLERTPDPRRWRLPVTPGVCSGLGALFGGCGLGAAAAALEVSTGRSLVWATAQYLSFARPPSTVELELTEAKVGGSVTQARAVGRVDGDEIFTVNAALGERPEKHRGEWAEMAPVPPPPDCPPRQLFEQHQGTISSRLDARIADARMFDELDGKAGDGRSALWVRIPEVGEAAGQSAAALAVLGDYVPFGISQALGKPVGGNSLDNTLRVVQRLPSEWILADIRVQAVAGGFAHGVLHLWSQDRRLLATASQSVVVRDWG